MDGGRTHAPAVELTRRRLALIGAAALLVSAVGLMARPRSDRVEGHAYPVPSGSDRVQVEVLNGSGRDGLARRVTRDLRRQGLDVVSFGNAAGTDSTVVYLRRGSRDRAERVAGALGAGVVREAEDTLLRVDATVVLGADYGGPVEFRP